MSSRTACVHQCGVLPDPRSTPVPRVRCRLHQSLRRQHSPQAICQPAVMALSEECRVVHNRRAAVDQDLVHALEVACLGGDWAGVNPSPRAVAGLGLGLVLEPALAVAKA